MCFENFSSNQLIEKYEVSLINLIYSHCRQTTLFSMERDTRAYVGK